MLNRRFAKVMLAVATALPATAALGCSSSSTDHKETAAVEPGELAGAKELLSYEWTLEPGVEKYYCVYKTVTEDTWISGFSPTEPAGTHHVVVGYDEPTKPDRVVSSEDGTTSADTCSGVQLSQNMLYFGGVGAGSVTMPPGVALKIPAGKQLFVGLHLFNSSQKTLTGRSGMKIVSPDPSTVVNEAEAIGAGKLAGLIVPPGKSKQNGVCTMTADATTFAVVAHMHLTGAHMKTTAGTPGTPLTTILDSDYSFGEQLYVPVDPPIALHKNDIVNVECDYENDSTTTLTFGESTHNEMCFTFLYRYPKIATTPLCVD